MLFTLAKKLKNVGVVGVLSLASLVGCSANNRENKVNLTAEPYYGFSAAVSNAISHKDPVLENVTLTGIISDFSGIKNAFITDGSGNVLYSLVKDRKIPKDMEKYVQLHKPYMLNHVDYLIRIKNPTLSQQYVLVVEDNNGEIKMDDQRAGDSADERAEKRILKKLNKNKKTK